MHVIGEDELRAAVREPEAFEAAELAFRALASGAVTVPPAIGLKIHDRAGELHVKCGYLHGSRFFVVKAATGFHENAQHGLPSGSGMMILFDSMTGFPLVLLQDNAYLTDLRTAAAGALAVKYLAVRGFKRVAIIGAGAQARYQLRALNSAFQWETTTVYSRARARTDELCEEMRAVISTEFVGAASAEDAVRGADVIITVTPSTAPIVRGAWLEPHATVIAVGSDGPEKRELHDDVFARADRIVCDLIEQCARLGELHHAIASGTVDLEDCTELGEIVAGRSVGRTGREMIICDLTGVGAQDAAIAELAYRRLSV